MSSSCLKRPNTTKRSLVGLRVAAKRDSGFYEAGSIVDSTSKQVSGGSDPSSSPATLSSVSSVSSSSGHKVLISFDDGTKHWYADRHVVGPGFQGPSSASLTIGQTVYCTVGHRETPGKIRTLPSAGGEVFQVSLEDGSGQVITRKQEDMRLIKSRKSSRTIGQDKDYHSLATGKADFDATLADSIARDALSRISTVASRKRAVPMDIINRGSRNSLPRHPSSCSSNSKLASRIQKSDRDLEDELLYAPLINEFIDPDSEESQGDMEDGSRRGRRGNGFEMMDECSAALVLMSLGASPATRQLEMHDDAGFSSASYPGGGFSSSWTSGKDNKSGVAQSQSPLDQVEVGRQTSPASLHDSTTASSSDEGIELASMQIDPCHLDHDYSAWAEPPEWTQSPVIERPRKRRPSNSVVTFQCTWPKCQHMEPSRTGIKRHIQNIHFTSAGLPAEDLEFYYNEVDVDEEKEGSAMSWAASTSFSESKSRAHAASNERSGRHRHRSALSVSSDHSGQTSTHCHSLAIPKAINIPRTSKRHDSEWESASAPQSAASPGLSDGFSTVSSSFGSGISKKIRDIKKCRKVYGMDNREMWCTQCKWKKACTRFSQE
ncbi:hypothetical protein BV898_00033 [Hypsibius exemplaris]|uniref:DUF4772 domain-containing protein n=1 Tax=Hypsibius exemplaris TaxID=2072580 RepID=A0A1W0XEJ1_HYPEX|nr:hypothetical protein BV898_00033 [Hypsibius exemplaris]